MDSKKIIADFQLIGNRVAKFSIETGNVDTKPAKAKVSYDVDYNVTNSEIENEKRYGEVEFIVEVVAKTSEDMLFKINLAMVGLFVGNAKVLEKEEFTRFLELNGVATLSHLSRAYILSVSSLTGLNPSVKLPMININSLKRYKDEMKD
ncbi:MAG: protein-export chaperone SecB [Clostridiales bacterium]|nr:protein-export chaperone SecB [Clostridiales bacterium]